MGAFPIMAMLGTAVLTSSLAGVDITERRWFLVGEDVNPWTAKFVFQTQTPNGDDFDISGYLDWLDHNDNPRGREFFSGTLSSEGAIDFTAQRVVCNENICVNGIYHAQLSPEGDAIVDGTWRGPGCASGSWFGVLEPCPDIEPNGFVDEFDLIFLLKEWGACTKGCPLFCWADLDGDGNSKTADLLILLANWGPCDA